MILIQSNLLRFCNNLDNDQIIEAARKSVLELAKSRNLKIKAIDVRLNPDVRHSPIDADVFYDKLKYVMELNPDDIPFLMPVVEGLNSFIARQRLPANFGIGYPVNPREEEEEVRTHRRMARYDKDRVPREVGA